MGMNPKSTYLVHNTALNLEPKVVPSTEIFPRMEKIKFETL